MFYCYMSTFKKLIYFFLFILGLDTRSFNLFFCFFFSLFLIADSSGKNVNQKKLTTVIVLDIPKAFDKAWHKGFLYKLNWRNISSIANIDTLAIEIVTFTLTTHCHNYTSLSET